MKRLSVLFFIMTISGLAKAQLLLPPIGQIEKEDLQMKTCDIDPEADAYTLIKTGDFSFIRDVETHLLMVYRFRIKILQDKAVSRADIKLNFYSKGDFQSVTEIRGMTYNLDDNGNIVTTELAKSNIYRKDVSKGVSEVAFTLPAVKKGSIIDYTYTVTSGNFEDIPNWYFQDDIPTRYGRVHFSVPDYMNFTYHIHKVLPMEEQSNDAMAEAGKYFTMENVPALRDEPFMSASKDYLQYIDFQMSAYSNTEMVRKVRTTWEELNTELLDHEVLGSDLYKKISNTGDLDASLKNVTDSLAIMDTIYKYVRRHMDWDGEYRLFAANGIAAAWDHKRGSTADINLLLVNLLKKAGLRAYPLLVSTRGHGRINPTYPLLSQFNEVVAFVRISGQYYVLNAADKAMPSYLIPIDLQNSIGFLLDRKRFGLVTLSDQKHPYKIMAVLNSSLNNKGEIMGNASVYSYDYCKEQRCSALSGESLDGFKTRYFTGPYSNMKVDSLTVTNQDNDSLALDQEFTFTSKLKATGDYFFFPINIFLGLDKNLFTAEHRFSDVSFGYRQSFAISGSLEIPEGYRFDNLPRNMRMITQDTSISLERLVQADGNRVDYRILVKFNRPVYDVSEYDVFRDFYKKLFAALSDPILIRKKTE